MCDTEDRRPLTGASRWRGSPCLRLAVPALAAMAVAGPGTLRAGWEPGPLAVAPLSEQEGDPGIPLPSADPVERRRIATAMVYLVVGIAVAGVALIVLIILGGHRLRQRARSRMGRSPELDPLWYLRSAAKQGRGVSSAPADGERASSDAGGPESES